MEWYDQHTDTRQTQNNSPHVQPFVGAGRRKGITKMHQGAGRIYSASPLQDLSDDSGHVTWMKIQFGHL